jgi:hypothetical protein
MNILFLGKFYPQTLITTIAADSKGKVGMSNHNFEMSLINGLCQQEDITLLMNHINSTKHASLKGKAPYELIDDDDEDMRALMDLLKMHLIPADEVHLTPDLFK